MSALVTIVLPAFLFGLAYTLARRELALHRQAAVDGSDLFVYTRGRLVRRLTGVALLAALGATFAALGLAPPRSAGAASVFVGVMLAEVAGLLVLPIWDLVETARTARPGSGITHQEARPSGRRTPPRTPRPGGS